MTLKIVQITDTHLCDEHPARLDDLRLCIAAIRSESHRPEFILHTGDISHNGLTAEYESAMHAIEALDVPCFVLPGNRDNRAVMLDYYKDGYKDGAYPAQATQFFQYSIERYATRFLVLDTHSPHTNKGEFCDQRFAHLQQMLDQDTSKPVVVVMHHPPFEAMEIPDPFQFADWQHVKRLGDLFETTSAVRKIICGHVHRNIDSTVAGIPARALTCLAGDLRKGKVTEEERSQPVFRWHEFQS